jgi:hypothetical protein
MDEPINVENKKQNHQKPPLSVVKIACEILAGAALCIVALLVVCGTCIVLFGKPKTGGHGSELAIAGVLTMFIFVFPPLYVLGSAVGVYLLGSRGKQTGSFLITLPGGFLGLLVMVILVLTSGDSSVGTGEKIVIWGLLSLIGPIFATIAFNLTRRYKEPPSALRA